MTISKMLADSGSFTYFKDIHGYIYYLREIREDEGGVEAVSVYYPDQRGVRRQNGAYKYSKMVSHGLSYELAYMKKLLPVESFAKIMARRRHNEETGEEFLLVPFEEISEVYSPKAALQYILRGHLTELSQAAYDKITATISLLETQNINVT